MSGKEDPNKPPKEKKEKVPRLPIDPDRIRECIRYLKLLQKRTQLREDLEKTEKDIEAAELHNSFLGNLKGNILRPKVGETSGEKGKKPLEPSTSKGETSGQPSAGPSRPSTPASSGSGTKRASSREGESERKVRRRSVPPSSPNSQLGNYPQRKRKVPSTEELKEMTPEERRILHHKLRSVILESGRENPPEEPTEKEGPKEPEKEK